MKVNLTLEKTQGTSNRRPSPGTRRLLNYSTRTPESSRNSNFVLEGLGKVECNAYLTDTRRSSKYSSMTSDSIGEIGSDSRRMPHEPGGDSLETRLQSKAISFRFCFVLMSRAYDIIPQSPVRERKIVHTTNASFSNALRWRRWRRLRRRR